MANETKKNLNMTVFLHYIEKRDQLTLLTMSSDAAIPQHKQFIMKTKTN